jgi:hypothetical protein
MNGPVLAAIVTSSVSAIVATASALYGRHTARSMKLLESSLQSQRDADTARRDYEYEARKRLYERCEPVLFQGLEATENARRRVVSIARSCRQGDVREDGSGWLGQPGYYFQSSAFLLFAPGVTFKLLQRQLTAVDLSLDQRVHRLYELFRLVFASFTNDHDLSKEEPPLTYRPDDADPGEPNRERLLRKDPPIYRRQGLYTGVIERVTEALIIGRDDSARAMTFGEFVTAWDDSASSLADVKDDLLDLLIGFHPRRRPVLWRLLVTQALLYETLRAAADSRTDVAAFAVPEVSAGQFDWRHDAGGSASMEDPSIALTVGRNYLSRQFEAVRSRILATAGETSRG